MERFYIEYDDSSFGSICSPYIKDRNTGEQVDEDIYDLVNLLNKLAEGGDNNE